MQANKPSRNATPKVSGDTQPLVSAESADNVLICYDKSVVARRSWRTRGVKTERVIERIVWSKPLSEAIVWIKRSVVIKLEQSGGFTTEWRALTNTKIRRRNGM